MSDDYTAAWKGKHHQIAAEQDKPASKPRAKGKLSRRWMDGFSVGDPA